MAKDKKEKKDNSILKGLGKYAPSKVKATLPSYNATKALQQLAEGYGSPKVYGENRFKQTGYFTDEFVNEKNKITKWLSKED